MYYDNTNKGQSVTCYGVSLVALSVFCGKVPIVNNNNRKYLFLMSITYNGYEIPSHISYSALSTYVDCGQKYYLTRLAKVPETPAWYLAGGTAVHTATEQYDRALAEGTNVPDTNLFRDVFESEISSIQSQYPDVSLADWKAGGRVSKQWPNKENYDWWITNGPAMYDNWVKYRASMKVDVWQPADGVLGIELGVDFPVNDDFMLRMFIDRVFVNDAGEMIIMDLKTGSRAPSSDLQLAIYAAGIERVFGVRPQWGTYWMAREGTHSELVNLDYLPTDKVLSVVSQFDFARKNGIFIPNLSNCHYCSVATHCEWSKK